MIKCPYCQRLCKNRTGLAVHAHYKHNCKIVKAGTGNIWFDASPVRYRKMINKLRVI